MTNHLSTMADASEDAIPSSFPGNDAGGEDDDIPDLKFLASLAPSLQTRKRGEKDFEPQALRSQADALSAAREHMHDALSVERIHQPKSHMLATYNAESNTALVVDWRGPHGTTMGKDTVVGTKVIVGKDGKSKEVKVRKTSLLPEECLWLVERGSLDLRWPAASTGAERDVDEEARTGMPMSLQAAYAMIFGREEETGGKLTLEKYIVYTALKRAGYIVLRADDWDGLGTVRDPPADAVHLSQQHAPYQSLWTQYWTRIFATKPTEPEHPPHRRAIGPLVTPGLYRSYAQIYRLLQLIPYHDPTLPSADPQPPKSNPTPFHLHWYVYKAEGARAAKFKKSVPGEPDYRISVVDARETSVPSLTELSDLLATTPYDPYGKPGNLYARLTHGYRNVILAVVNQGIVSYLRISDSPFGTEKLWDRGAKPSRGKKSGGKKGRGKGRGGR